MNCKLRTRNSTTMLQQRRWVAHIRLTAASTMGQLTTTSSDARTVPGNDENVYSDIQPTNQTVTPSSIQTPICCSVAETKTSLLMSSLTLHAAAKTSKVWMNLYWGYSCMPVHMYIECHGMGGGRGEPQSYDRTHRERRQVDWSEAGIYSSVRARVQSWQPWESVVCHNPKTICNSMTKDKWNKNNINNNKKKTRE